ncbi:MAG: MBG-2 domain-containing protein, partial [Verrucomicrobia bacterium]|nr:MBG-2 domain-containing protein [Verrucomicrobiota bacterium]
MKKMIGTKVKRTIAGQLAFATAMIFSLPGNMLAQQTQTITAPSIDDVTYSTTSFSVAATSSSGLAVKYGVAGPATVNSSGLLTMIGKGSVTLFFFQDGDADYYPAAPVVKSFTINGATATVDLANASAVYDGTGQFLTPIQTDSAGATLNEPITVTYTDAAGNAVASPTNVGVYDATATITSGSSYSGSDTGTLTITPGVATVTISGISQSYDGAQKPVTVVTVPAGLSVTTTYGGSFVPAAAIEAVAAVLYAEGDVIPEGKAVGDVKTAAVDAVAAVIAPSSAGDYAVTATVVDDNYSGSSSATLTIGSVVIDTTAVTYTGVAQSPSVTLVPSDLTHTVTYTDSAGEAVSATKNADTYTVTVSVSDVRYPGDISASYTINPAPLTADLGDLSISYTSVAPSSEVWAGTLSFSDVAAVEAVAAVLYVEGDTIPEGKAVGDVKTAAVDAVTFSGFVGGESATTEVVAAVAGVAAVAEVLYVEGDTIPDGKAVGDVKTAAVSAVAAVPAVLNVVTAGLVVSYDKPVSNGGVYVATPAGLSSKNYTFTYTVGSLEVTKLSAAITLTNTSQGYTGSVLGVTATPSIEGLAVDLVYRDSEGVVVDGPISQGTYFVTATIDDPNYAGVKQSQLIITAAETNLVLGDLPDVVYSATPITLQATATGDRPVLYFVTGSASASGNVITLKSAGTVRVTAYVAGTDDYESAYVAKTFTVSKAPASVVMADVSGIYTGLGQGLLATVTSESGTTLTVDVGLEYKDAGGNTVVSPTDVGVYAVTGTINDTKYSGSTTGILTILKAPLTITADAQSKEYLEANPALTLKYDGFVNSEGNSVFTTQPTVATAADENSALGVYGIVVYGAVATNYAITHVDSTLTVEKNTIAVTLAGLSQTYTGSGLAVTATPAVADISVVVTYADSAGAAVASPTNAGTYTVTATVDDALYRGTATGTLTIGKATATVTLSDLASTYNGSPKVAAVTTDPVGLTVDLTYSQGATLVAPIAAVQAAAAVEAVAAVAAVAEVLYVEG